METVGHLGYGCRHGLVAERLPPEFVRLAEKRQDLIDRAFNAIGTRGSC